MPPAPKHTRRWLQFSLGTMLVVMTALAMFIAYHVNWVRGRHQLLADVDEKYLLVDAAGGGSQPIQRCQSPGCLCLFGEPGFVGVYIRVEGDRDQLTESDVKLVRRTRRLFPESIIILHGENWIGPFEDDRYRVYSERVKH